MIPNPFIGFARRLLVIAGLGISLASAQTTIYSDNFDGGTSDIHSTSPDVTSGAATWTAAPVFNADGSVERPAVTTSYGSMTLPFIPVDGFVYTLDASFSGVTGDTDWLGLGFAKGESSGSGAADRFTGANVKGATWMLFRGTTPDPVATNGNKIQRGLAAADTADWLDPTLWDLEGGDIDLRIVLNTGGGTGEWTATWFAKLPGDVNFKLVGATTKVPHDASNYTSVGISASNTSSTTGTGGTIESFSLTAAEAQPVIFADDFSGDTGDVNGLTPDITTGGATWTASPVFNADGSLDRPVGGRGSLTLPFTPVDGRIYTLDASFSGVTGDTDWLALGFAKGQAETSTLSDRFTSPGIVVGTTWMLFRGDNPDASFVNKIQQGLGTSTPSDWLALADRDGGDIDLRVLLDTTGGTGAWNATWYAKLPADGSYTEVGATTTVPHDPSKFTSVGIAASNTSSTDGTGGTIESFSLSASIPGGSQDHWDRVRWERKRHPHPRRPGCRLHRPAVRQPRRILGHPRHCQRQYLDHRRGRRRSRRQRQGFLPRPELVRPISSTQNET